jgi:hypothetical protein
MEVDKNLILNMVYTFLEDNGYLEALGVLQRESGVAYMLDRIKEGQWEVVLKGLDRINLKEELLYELIEQVVFELVEENDGKIGKLEQILYFKIKFRF